MANFLEDSDKKLSADDWLAAVKDAERRGEFLEAYDLASRGLAAYPDDVWLQHRAVLTLARSGATEQAHALFQTLGLANRSEEDIAAVAARLAKDRALASSGAERTARATFAADLYEAIYRRTGGYYPGINAATMRLLAGEPKSAANLARRVLDACSKIHSKDSNDAYYLAATRAEAALVLGDIDAARTALQQAAITHAGDYAAVGTSRKQLRLVCKLKGIDVSILTPLKSPTVIDYVGHLISPPGKVGRFTAESEGHVADQITAYLAEREVGYGYGSLACGADIFFAEALLARNAELHVVLPFDKDEFKEISVVRGGVSWSNRFDDCLRKATSVTYATEDAYMGDDLLFTYASRLAMGLTLLRASYLDTAVEQAAVWDGKPATVSFGTAADVTFWRSMGLNTYVISCASEANGDEMLVPITKDVLPSHKRQIRAMIFGDVKGFSKLREPQLPVFLREVMGPLGSVIDTYDKDVLYRNTWGDGIFVVLSDAPIAARCALDLQAAMGQIKLETVGLPSYLALRIGAHMGPVFRGYDPVLKREIFFGAHVTRTARIEPVTPEGNVYVTEPFAARLALERYQRFLFEYVGQMPAAKGYGLMRMYVLKRRL